MVRKSSTFGLVALSMAASVSGFVSSPTPRGTQQHVRAPLHMSVSLPDDNSNNKPSSSSSSSSQQSENSINPTDNHDNLEQQYLNTERYNGYEGGDFPLPDELEVPETRQLRWEREALIQSKFASGDELFELRQRIATLHSDIVNLRAEQLDGLADERTGTDRRIVAYEKEMLALNGRDPEFMYAVSSELMEKAQADGDEELIAKYKIQMEEARLCIPQLNMHGLWVGKYGEHGYEMINITYSGDTLIATKVTGDQNVPKGEISFTVNLSPKANPESSTVSGLEPIELNPKAARQWGKKYLPRHLGKGQVASENFQNAQWMEGQLILVGRFFSFAWVPIGHQVFFGRPSSELTLKMLKEAKEEEMKRDHVAVMRDVAQNMLDETYWTEKEEIGYFAEEGCFE